MAKQFRLELVVMAGLVLFAGCRSAKKDTSTAAPSPYAPITYGTPTTVPPYPTTPQGGGLPANPAAVTPGQPGALR
jgi:hypothetical protein